MFDLAIASAHWLGFAGALLLFWRYRPSLERRGVVWLGLACVFLGNTELWIAGDRSFLLKDAELDFSIGLYQGLARLAPGTRFAHGLGGGLDVAASSILAGRVLSLEEMLWSRFSPGLTQFLYINLNLAVAFVGMYRLCRGFSLDRTLSGLTAAFFALSMEPAPWSIGLGNSLTPLLAHLLVGRLGRRSYGQGVLAGALFHAVTCTPTHSVVATMPALMLVALLRGWLTPLRVLPGILVMLGLVLANCAEGIFAKLLVSPFSARGGESEDGLLAMLGMSRLAHGGLTVGVAFLAGRRLGTRVAALVTLGLAVPAAFSLASGTIALLAPLKAISFSYLVGRMDVPVLLSLGMATAALSDRQSPWLARPAARYATLLACLAVALLSERHAFNILTWLNQGGLTLERAMREQLADRPWQPAAPVRTVSIPYRLVPNLAFANGLDTLDTVTNLTPAAHHRFWRWITWPTHVYSSHPSLFFANADFRCCDGYRLESFADPTLLAVGNVGFVLSVVPLEDDGLRQVAGPTGPALDLPRSTQGSLERMRLMAGLLIHPAGIRVYALPDPLPRLYAAQGLVTAPAGLGEAEMIALIRTHAPRFQPVVRAEDRPATPLPEGAVRLGEWHLVQDGVRAEIREGQGLVVFNTSWLPFWKARVDGISTTVFPVNGAQMAAVVPEGHRVLELRYERPTLRETLLGSKPN